MLPHVESSPADQLDLDALATRMGRENLERRLHRQQLHIAGKAWHGKGLFRFEHRVNFPKLVSTAFKCVGLYGRGYRNYLAIRVVENVVSLPGLPSAFDGLRVLQIADLHTDLDDALPGAVIARLQGLQYDLCVNTGDFRNRTRDSTHASMAATRRIYDHIHGPCYGIFGNHDFIEKVPDLEAMGIRLLLNESVSIERDGQQLWLSGIDDAHFYGSHDIARARAAVPEGAFAIMLSHTPETYREVAAAGYRFMLSGHTHGGQICLPGGRIISGHCEAPHAMWRGPWHYGELQGYTSPGTGSGSSPLRFNCPPELTVHVLRKPPE